MSGPVTTAMTFHCSICDETSTEICTWCTKDACGLHLCQKCKRCSDCCQCDVPLDKLDKKGAAQNGF